MGKGLEALEELEGLDGLEDSRIGGMRTKIDTNSRDLEDCEIEGIGGIEGMMASTRVNTKSFKKLFEN